MYSSSFDLYGGINGGGSSNGGSSGSGRYETLFDRKPSYLSSTTSDFLSSSSSGGGREKESAYDRYTSSLINDLTSHRTGAYTTTSSSYGATGNGSNYNNDDYLYGGSSSSSSRPSYSSSTNRRRYVFDPEIELISSKYSSAYGSTNNASTSGYTSSATAAPSSGYSSSSYLKSDTGGYTPSYRSTTSAASRFGAISSAPAFDKFGKELSNYERWKLSSGVYEDTFNNNNNSSVTSSSSSAASSSAASSGAGTTTGNVNSVVNGNADFSSSTMTNGNEAQTLRRKRFPGRLGSAAAADDDLLIKPASSALTFKDREFSVIPQSKSSFLDDDDDSGGLSPPAITGSRFTGKSAVRSRLASVEPAAATNGFLPSISNGGGSSSSNYNSKIVTSFPADVRSKLIGYDVRDVRGDGGCYYRCLSVYFTGAEDSYNKFRKEVMSFIKDHEDSYKSMIRSEVGYASINDYFSRKTRSDRQEFAETTEIIATSCLYNINIHVLALVPGSRRSWEWLHFDPSIGNGKPSTATRDIHLYNQGSVHFMLCKPK